MIKIFKFRANDLNPSAGKQIEFNSAVAKDFFHFVKERETIVCHYINANGKEEKIIESDLSLSPARGDYKIYQNSNGKQNLKDFFLGTLHLTMENNGDDYFALRQRGGNHYDLFYFPKSIVITDIYSRLSLHKNEFLINEEFEIDSDKIDNNSKVYTTALRSKPFMILAGISGTGKSRIVREFAYMTCPKDLQDKDGTTPGNYCMIEVKPNWHDSTELLGYYSAMNKEYVFTKFDRFVVKAWLNPETPFFVCLDEMNLAPVEQYFAEFLSVLETRSRDQEGNIASGALIEAKYFDDSSKMVKDLGLESTDEWAIKVRDHIVNKGLTLPPNLMVIGTVNMDDTTYQFSRKVIDRAMTIEMNGGELKNMFGNSRNLQYRVDPIGLSAFKARYLNADEVVEAHAKYANSIRELLPQKIEGLNKVLEYTPFQVSYRVLNELVVYTGVLLDEAKAKGAEINFEQIAANAFDQITLMKILPRIEGDEDMFIRGGQNVLANLQSLFAPESASYKKLTEMKERLDRTGFTRFWP